MSNTENLEYSPHLFKQMTLKVNLSSLNRDILMTCAKGYKIIFNDDRDLETCCDAVLNLIMSTYVKDVDYSTLAIRGKVLQLDIDTLSVVSTLTEAELSVIDTVVTIASSIPLIHASIDSIVDMLTRYSEEVANGTVRDRKEIDFIWNSEYIKTVYGCVGTLLNMYIKTDAHQLMSSMSKLVTIRLIESRWRSE